jgi:hypothetical protein
MSFWSVSRKKERFPTGYAMSYASAVSSQKIMPRSAVISIRHNGCVLPYLSLVSDIETLVTDRSAPGSLFL